MDKFRKLTGTACPIDQANVNTDQIIPARFLKRTRDQGFGQVLFNDLRRDAEGREKPDFPLNRPAWREAKIVVAARNFGCRIPPVWSENSPTPQRPSRSKAAN